MLFCYNLLNIVDDDDDVYIFGDGGVFDYLVILLIYGLKLVEVG
jgi:hypothetical protein